MTDPAEEQLDIWTVTVPEPLPPIPALPTGARERRRGDRGGSIDAAKVPDRPEKYVEVLAILSRHSHADFELQRELPHIHPGTICKRRLRLEHAGLVEEVPDVMRATPHGVPAMTFRITDAGRQVLTEWRQLHSESSGPTPPTRGEDSTSGSSMPFGTPLGSGPSSAAG